LQGAEIQKLMQRNTRNKTPHRHPLKKGFKNNFSSTIDQNNRQNYDHSALAKNTTSSNAAQPAKPPYSDAYQTYLANIPTNQIIELQK
jgi:hypothetical protein